jgi:tetratricopeptide (TPR) repeat protein
MNAAAHKGALHTAALLGAAIFLAYGNALLWGQFQFDDYKVIVDNSTVHSWLAWRDNLTHGIRPLLKFTYTLDWTSGWGAVGFHLTNLLIHFANVLLVWALSRRFAEAQPALRAQGPAISLFTALLFAVHPTHSEAVTYICGRSSALMTLFYLGGTLAYLTGRRDHNKFHLHVLVPFCFLLALSVKETAATFPLALLALEFCCGGTWRTALRRQWSSWLLLAAGIAFFFSHENYLREMEISAGLNSLAGNLANQALAVAYLLRQWLLPLWLNIDPDLPVQRDLSAVVPQLLLLATLFLMMLMAFRRRPWISFAIAWMLIQLLPLHLFLPRLDVANDRQMYLVGWPLALLLGAELALRLPRRAFAILATALILAAGGLTVARNRDYYDEIALWEATAQLSPDKARVRNNLGYAYHLAGRNAEARSEYRHALVIDPAYYKARYNLARLDAEGL